ncbi:hypothetical protein Kpol_1039p24 [Vanderwaltozyma polyspora DSM 70294]|uniref:Vacuolar segregation protein 7 n=1 Tax=Vanderwaltozyma polyspora (strain ATCC 22028 / DSM 70294 / BCRC 21397 / CBS 2163 / NBRC 10782 / NRRL Y-8283 / UCD 57-17) TaxID=436907 RepID=A7THF1_VANPO|nr:uncharacterized protein Kpol_1039p24 [Vanderwaltozyma polyspora DSM 70294]EDO18275.1 hypothetical protein Kpol_1039p24 [Vanderwaltozyma polyspora DSM 70294]
MNEEGHNFIVETETVEAPVSNIILPTPNASSINIARGSSSNIPNTSQERYNNDNSNVSKDVNQTNASNEVEHTGISLKQNIAPQINGSKPIMSSVSLASSGTVSTVASSNDHQVQRNLIDNNPLSMHAPQSVRNKKSNLLITSPVLVGSGNNLGSVTVTSTTTGAGVSLIDEISNDFKPSDNEINETLKKPILGHISSSDQQSMESANRTAYGGRQSKLNIEDANVTALTTTGTVAAATNNNNNLSSQSSNSNSPAVVPSPVPHIVSNKLTDLKPNKILERPSMPMMNSREILLEDKRPDLQKKAPLSSMMSEEPTISQDTDSLQKPTKADIFAAKLASAVGENEISDSEETFVYESTANSSKNVKLANPQEMLNEFSDHSKSQYSHTNGTNKSYGIAPKMSVPLLNSSNQNFLNKLKNHRHTSTGGIALGSKFNGTPNQSTSSHLGPSFQAAFTIPDDIPSLRSMSSQNKQHDIQSIKSYSSGHHPPTRRMNVPPTFNVGVNSPTVKNSNFPVVANSKTRQRNNGFTSTTSSRKASMSNVAMRQPSVSRHRIPSNANNGIVRTNSKRRLRTTASKIFDTNGAPLRRYSGVPDHVNLEDYIEQSNFSPMSNSVIKHEPVNDYFEPKKVNYIRDGCIHDDHFKDPSIIQEEDSETTDDQNNTGNLKGNGHSKNEISLQPNEDEEDDDYQSMFYYNHGGDLEARPQISDYEEDDECSELDDAEDDPRIYNTYQYYQDQGKLNKNPRFQDYYTFSTQPQPSEYVDRFQTKASVIHGDVHENSPLRSPGRRYFPDETNYSPHNFTTQRYTLSKFRNCIYFSFAVIFLVTLGFTLGFLLATNKELQGFNILFMDNIISSSDELVFDITAGAYNPGFFTIGVVAADIDIFAKSAYIKNINDGGSQGENDSPSMETILLGSVQSLESPLQFQGEFFRRHYGVSSSSLKLLNPGANDAKHEISKGYKNVNSMMDDVEKWKLLIKHDYELIIKGNLKYKIPFFNSERLISIQKNAEVHPGQDDDGTLLNTQNGNKIDTNNKENQ